MKLTDALLGEHAVLYDLFGHLQETVANSDDTDEIRRVAAVLERLLVSHARIEEQLLFPRLEPHLGQMGPLTVMRAEHERIDELLAAARGEGDRDSLRSILGRLLETAHDHFRKEENVLFGMAQQFLGEAALTELGDQWAATRSVIVDAPGCGGGF